MYGDDKFYSHLQRAVTDVADGYSLLKRMKTKVAQLTNSKVHKRLKDEREREELNAYN